MITTPSVISYHNWFENIPKRHIGKRFEDGLEFTPAMRVGCLMYIAFLYENREAVSPVEQSELPMAISALWSVYRDVGVY